MIQLLDKVFGKRGIAPGEKLRDIDDQSQDEKQLVNYVRQKLEERRGTPGRVAHEATWMQNTAYLLGYDQVYYDTNTKAFRTAANITGRGVANQKTRLYVNTILPTVQNRLSRLCKVPPKYDVRPNSPETEDEDAATLSLQVLNFYWEKLKLNNKRIRLYMWIQQCGYAFGQTSWDDCAGERMYNPDDQSEWIHEGDVRFDIRSPFEIFEDPLCKDEFEDAIDIIAARVKDLEYFRERYDRGYLVKEEDAWLLSLQYEGRLNTLSPQAPYAGNTQTQMKNSAIEIVLYERPSKRYQNGRMVVVASGVLLANKDLPINEIPFAKFDDIVVAGKFASEAIITHLRPVADQYNRIVSKRADFLNKLLAGKYIADRRSRLDQEAITDENAEVILHTGREGVNPPQAVQPPTIPSYAYQESEEFRNMHYDISGIGEISRGTLPAAGIPAIGMQFLQEQDSTRIGIEVEQHEHAWATVGRHILKFVNKYVKSDRLLKMSDRNQGYVVKKWKGESLRNHFDVHVVRGSTLPNSKVLGRQEILNLYDRGLLGMQGDPKVVEKVLAWLDYGEVQEVWVDHSLDMKMIREMLEKIEENQVPDAHELDNHDLVIAEFNRYRKSDKFKRFTPEQKAIFWGVVEWHIQALVSMMNPDIAADNKMKTEGDQVMQSIQKNPGLIQPYLEAEEEMMSTVDQAAAAGVNEMDLMSDDGGNLEV